MQLADFLTMWIIIIIYHHRDKTIQLAGFKLAQKFREKWLLPQDKTGRSFIGWGRSQDSVYLSPYWKRYIQDSQPTLPHCLGELTKKETNFTVDLFILTSKPIKWCKVTKIYVGKCIISGHIKFIHIFFFFFFFFFFLKLTILFRRSSQNIKICGLISKL